MKKIAANLLSDHKITLTYDQNAYQFLLEKSLNNLEKGGRGIGNVVESCLINPLARYIFEHQDSRVIHILGIQEKEQQYLLTIS